MAIDEFLAESSVYTHYNMFSLSTSHILSNLLCWGLRRDPALFMPWQTTRFGDVSPTENYHCLGPFSTMDRDLRYQGTGARLGKD